MQGNKNKSLTSNSLFYLMSNVLNVFFPFLTGIYVAHVLFPDTIGRVESARNLAQYFVIFAFLGIPTYGLREISRARNNRSELAKIYSELMIINAISTIVFASIYYCIIFCVPYYKPNIKIYIVTGVAIIFNLINNSWLYEGLEEFKYISLRNLVFKILTFVLLVCLVKEQDDYIIYAAITVFGAVGNYIINIANAHKFTSFSFDDINIKRHLKPIMYLVAVNLAIEIYSLVDITMLGFLSNEENVAFYSYAVKIYRVFLQIINTFTMVLVPRLAVYYKEKKNEELNDVLTKTMKVILVISIPMIVGIDFVGNDIICLLYGEKYIRSAFVLKILDIILVISPIGYLLGSRMLLVAKQENKMIIPVTLGAITNVILNYLLIICYAEVGAAVASAIGEIVVMATYLVFGKKYYKLNSFKTTMIKESIALVLMSIGLYLLGFAGFNRALSISLKVITGVCIYFATLIVLKEEIVYFYFNKILNKLRKLDV